MVLTEPVTHKESNVAIWGVKRHRDDRPVVDGESSVPSCCALEEDGGEVEEAPDLVLDLELISPIPPSWDRTVRTANSILPTIFPLLHAIPNNSTQNLYQIYRNELQLLSLETLPQHFFQTIRTNASKFLPGNEKRLVEAIEHVHRHVPVGRHIEDGSRKLSVDRYHLPSATRRRKKKQNEQKNIPRS